MAKKIFWTPYSLARKKDYELQPTQTDRLLDQSSYNPSCHKVTYDYTDFEETGATTLRLEEKAYKTRLTT